MSWFSIIWVAIAQVFGIFVLDCDPRIAIAVWAGFTIGTWSQWYLLRPVIRAARKVQAEYNRRMGIKP